MHSRVHRTTRVAPGERLVAERSLLGPLPRRRYDTAYAEARRVHVAVPMLEWRGVRYSVPPSALGQRVEVRQEVDEECIEVRFAGETIAKHRLATGDVREVWDGMHFQAAQRAALARHRPHLHVVREDEPTMLPRRLELPEGDYDVAPLDLGRYEPDEGHLGVEGSVDIASGDDTGDGFSGGEAL